MRIEAEGYDTKYCYPGSNVLKNKLDIRNQEELAETERFITFRRTLALEREPVKGNLDLKHLQKIHKYIFGDLYDWAGKIRTVDIAKGNLFCMVQHVNTMADDIFGKLQRENYLIGCPAELIPFRLAYYFGEINALHPFREGNGRSQREFIRELAAVSGYELNYKHITEKEMLEASIEAFDLNYGKLEQLLKAGMRKLSYSEQRMQCESIAAGFGELAKSFGEYIGYIDGIKEDLKVAGFKPTDEAVQKMEVLHQKAHKELTVRDVQEMLKCGIETLDADQSYIVSLKAVGKAFIKEEKKRSLKR